MSYSLSIKKKKCKIIPINNKRIKIDYNKKKKIIIKILALSKFITRYKYISTNQELILVQNIKKYHDLSHSEFLKKWDKSIINCDNNSIASFLRLPTQYILKLLFSDESRNKMANIYIDNIRPTNKISKISSYCTNNCNSLFCINAIQCVSLISSSYIDNLYDNLSIINQVNPYYLLLQSISSYCGLLVKNISKGIDIKLLSKTKNTNERFDQTNTDDSQLQKLWKYGIPPLRQIRRMIIYYAILHSINDLFPIKNLNIYCNNYTYNNLKKDILQISYKIVPKYKNKQITLLKKWLLNKKQLDISKVIKKHKIIWNTDDIFIIIEKMLKKKVLPNLKNINNTELPKDTCNTIIENLAKQLLCVLIYVSTYESIFAITAILL